MSNKNGEDFGILLNVAFGVFKSDLHAHLAQAGFDDLGPSFGYLFRMLADGPLNLKAIAERLEITPQGALKIVNDMVAKDYLARSEDEADARVRQLALTPRARQALAQARAFHRQFEKDLGTRIGVQKAAAARAALEDIVAHYEGDTLRLRAR
jgi:DNA-binding MarR family transcriptional regulator